MDTSTGFDRIVVIDSSSTGSKRKSLQLAVSFGWSRIPITECSTANEQANNIASFPRLSRYMVIRALAISVGGDVDVLSQQRRLFCLCKNSPGRLWQV